MLIIHTSVNSYGYGKIIICHGVDEKSDLHDIMETLITDYPGDVEYEEVENEEEYNEDYTEDYTLIYVNGGEWLAVTKISIIEENLWYDLVESMDIKKYKEVTL